jgi:putative CocE/NonD family hydrolase
MDFGGDAVIDLHALQRRFLARWVTGHDADGLDGEPPVRLFVMGENRWRDEWEWPLSRTRWTELFLGDDGTLVERPPADDRPDAYIYDPAHPVITTGGNHSLVNPGITVGPVDQRDVEARPDVVSFTGPVLTAPLEVTGSISATIWFSSDARDTDVTARLVDVHPDGRAINICEGVLRARYRESFERPTLLTPGEPAAIPIDLGVTSNVFLPGHRVRLDISSSNFPRIDRNLNTGGPIGQETEWRVAHQRIHHSVARPSRIRLPAIPR